MISERLLSLAVRAMNGHYLNLKPVAEHRLPHAQRGKQYLLYAHVPFCQSLCPYCSFNRFPFEEGAARRYFSDLRQEMRMLQDLGYDFASLYIGGGTPTILVDELALTIELARDLFSVADVSCETNPNHLVPEVTDRLRGLVDRMSVGVQSFDDSLLRQMRRYDKYGSADQILERLQRCAEDRPFQSLNVDMIFNFPSQTEQMLRHDLDMVKECGCNQTTFYPLMASPAVERNLKATVGNVDYGRERRMYEIICEVLTAGEDARFEFGSAWTFNERASNRAAGAGEADPIIDEYIVDFEEYPAIGSGGMAFLDRALYVNTFSLDAYSQLVGSGQMSVASVKRFSKRDHMRYRFMMQLFGLELDKQQWRRDFGCGVASGLLAEYAFMKAAGAFAVDDAERITLTPKGRYLLVAMMRQFFVGVNSVRDKAREEAGIVLA